MKMSILDEDEYTRHGKLCLKDIFVLKRSVNFKTAIYAPKFQINLSYIP